MALAESKHADQTEQNREPRNKFVHLEPNDFQQRLQEHSWKITFHLP